MTERDPYDPADWADSSPAEHCLIILRSLDGLPSSWMDEERG